MPSWQHRKLTATETVENKNHWTASAPLICMVLGSARSASCQQTGNGAFTAPVRAGESPVGNQHIVPGNVHNSHSGVLGQHSLEVLGQKSKAVAVMLAANNVASMWKVPAEMLDLLVSSFSFITYFLE